MIWFTTHSLELCPLHVKEIQLIKNFSSSVPITKFILAEFTPNMYFGLKYIHEKLFGKVLKTDPYFSQKLPKMYILSFYKYIINSFNSFDKICVKNISISSFTIEKLLSF